MSLSICRYLLDCCRNNSEYYSEIKNDLTSYSYRSSFDEKKNFLTSDESEEPLRITNTNKKKIRLKKLFLKIRLIWQLGVN